MSTARNPIQPAKPTEEEAVKVLREHLDNEEAEMLTQRYLNADEAAKTATAWPTAKRRILNTKLTPKP